MSDIFLRLYCVFYLIMTSLLIAYVIPPNKNPLIINTNTFLFVSRSISIDLTVRVPWNTFFGVSPGSVYRLLLLVTSCKSGFNALSANDKNTLSRSPPLWDCVRLFLWHCLRPRVCININKEYLLILISYLTILNAQKSNTPI